MIFNLFKKKKREPENFEVILNYFKELERNFEKLSEELENLKKENKFNIQKIGIIRFNPFKEIGGNQSFSIALLDGNNDGVVITSLYSREGNRVYGKPIKNCLSEYSLSEEEKRAIEKAKLTSRDNSCSHSNYGNKKSKFNFKTTGGGNFRSH